MSCWLGCGATSSPESCARVYRSSSAERRDGLLLDPMADGPALTAGGSAESEIPPHSRSGSPGNTEFRQLERN